MGSDIRLPSSEEIVTEFGRFKPNGITGIITPLARVSLFVGFVYFTDLQCSLLAAWNVEEQTLAEKQLLEVVTQMRSLNQDKLLFIQQHYDLTVDFIFLLQRKAYSKL